jgi:uncharacterized protein (TIGR03437 family)
MKFLNHLRIALLGLVALAGLPIRGQIPVELSPIPARTYGHARQTLNTTEANLVEGRELNTPSGVALDTSQNPPITYVADTGNNRVLFWRNARSANGQMADGVIGQRDLVTTFPGGPGSGFTIGFRSPTGMAVDRNGNLYVADTANNRILRFPRPAQQTGDLIQPDFVMGQTNFTSSAANQNELNASARTLAFSRDGQVYRVALLFDPSGNLWVTDPGNHRVLRYPAAVLAPGSGNAPEADLVLGQSDFSSRNTFELGTLGPLQKSGLRFPGTLALDGGGRLYVGDQLGRVLVYTGPLRTGLAASRVLGIVVNVQGQPPRPPVNEFSLETPEGMFVFNNQVYVVDTLVNRIVRYDPFESWAEETVLVPSPPARAVFGQPDLLSFRANRGGRSATDSSFFRPTNAAVVGTDLYLCDSANHRLLVIPISSNNLMPAVRVQGQLGMTYNSRNLIEGRELFTVTGLLDLPNGGGRAILSGGVTIDRTSSPPRLYVADSGNNRILGFANALTVKPGDLADIIIGQADRFSGVVNSPANDADVLNDTGLFNPTGIITDAQGNLWVADTGNGRVLRFARPFDQPRDRQQRASLVIGQSNFNIKLTDPTRTNMRSPYGIALTVDGHLIVSDSALNRLLYFRRPPNGDFTNGQAANTVFGQRDFTSQATADGDSRFNVPGHLATDTDDRVYVCDMGKSRIVIFDRVPTAANDPAPVLVLRTALNPNDGLRNPQGITVSERTGEIWVADGQNNRLVRFPRFDLLIFNPLANFRIDAPSPVALALDPLDNLVVADGTNRLAFHYARLVAISAAHYLDRDLSPGLVATMAPLGIRFTENTMTFSSVPIPKVMDDVEVLVNGEAAPLYYISPTIINFYVPMSTPTSGTIDVLVQKKSTGQILASSALPAAVATPGFFTTTQNGRGQIAALNEDNTVNSASNPVGRGRVIQLYATGQGFLPDAPPDGEPAPTNRLVSTPLRPRVIVNTTDGEVLFSGLAPGFVGVWQLNVKVPESVPPGNSIVVAILHLGIPSNSNRGGGTPIQTTIAVR